jgi:hypothetical protein
LSLKVVGKKFTSLEYIVSCILMQITFIQCIFGKEEYFFPLPNGVVHITLTNVFFKGV